MLCLPVAASFLYSCCSRAPSDRYITEAEFATQGSGQDHDEGQWIQTILTKRKIIRRYIIAEDSNLSRVSHVAHDTI